MSIGIKLIQELRKQTGIGLGMCKKALENTNGDVAAAVDWLKKQGHAQAGKVADRETSQGIVAMVACDTCASLVMLGCETDFVAKNDQFGQFAHELAKTACNSQSESVEVLTESKMQDGRKVADAVIAEIATIKENMVIKHVTTLKAEGAKLAGYVYRTEMTSVPNIGKKGCIVAYKGGDENLAKDIAMHIIAHDTDYLLPEHVPAEYVEKEKSIMKDRMIEEGKPANVLDKILDGFANKLYSEQTLLKQAFLKDQNKTVEQVCKENGLEILAFEKVSV